MKDRIISITESEYEELKEKIAELKNKMEKAAAILRKDVNFPELCDGCEVLEILGFKKESDMIEEEENV